MNFKKVGLLATSFLLIGSVTLGLTACSSSSSSISEDLDRTITKLAIPKQSGSYTIPGTTKTIYEDQYYIKKQDVMAYVIAFKKMPSNYYIASSRSTCVS